MSVEACTVQLGEKARLKILLSSGSSPGFTAGARLQLQPFEGSRFRRRSDMQMLCTTKYFEALRHSDFFSCLPPQPFDTMHSPAMEFAVNRPQA
jgi:hypothetical protein